MLVNSKAISKGREGRRQGKKEEGKGGGQRERERGKERQRMGIWLGAGWKLSTLVVILL